MRSKNITVEVAASEIGVTKSHIYTLIRAGELIAIDISVSGNGGPRSLRVSAESVDMFISSRTVDPERYWE